MRYNPQMAQLITELVFKHIDRMNDFCEQNTAEEIIKSFTEGFDNIWNDFTRD